MSNSKITIKNIFRKNWRQNKMNNDIFTLSTETVKQVNILIDKNMLKDAKNLLIQFNTFLQATNLLETMLKNI